MKAFLGLIKILFLNRIRDKGAIFWTLLFPMMFLIIFGLAFGPDITPLPSSSEDTKTKVGVFFDANIDKELRELIIALSDTYKLELFEAKDLEDLKDGVDKGRSNIAFGMYFKGDKKEIEYKLILNANKQSQNSYYLSIMNSFSGDLQKKVANFKDILEVKFEDVSFTVKKITNIGYIIAGVIALSISSSGIMALIISLGYFRKNNTLKRLLSTPLSGSTFLYGNILINLLVAFISVLILVLLAILIFRIQFTLMPLEFLATYLASMLFMTALGGFFLLFLREPNAAMNVSNILINIMIFFSGVYFPLDLLPEWMKQLALFLPMTYIAQNMRYVLGQEYVPGANFWWSTIVFFVIAGISIPLIGRIIFYREKK